VLVWLALLWVAEQPRLEADILSLNTRSRELRDGSTNEWRVVEKRVAWDGQRTAVVVCDMWDKHWCPDATERVGELAPVMNRVIANAREKGALIIHCPSDTMTYYKDHEGRRLAQAAPKVETKVPLQGWCSLQGHKEPPLPIDDSDGGCDGCPDSPNYRAWSRQHPAIEIKPGDAITDSVEAFYLMRQRGITNVIVMGVHENMCVLGRPFSIRQMVAQGQNVVLMRDMTDSMYNHRQKPYVSHYVGTDLVCEHIEKYWCPSITSVDFLGGTPFRFRSDVRKRVAIITGENEYSTADTLAEFARKELNWRGIEVAYVSASEKEGDGEFVNWEALREADAVLISVRRRAPRREMLSLLKAHVARGKSVIGIRTASHAFDARPADGEHEAWPLFDDEVLGANYLGHYGNKPPVGAHTVLEVGAGVGRNPVLTGVDGAGLRVTSHLYKYGSVSDDVTVLLRGHVENQNEDQPVAWVREKEGGRVFYTSMGNVDDFRQTPFRRLLLNGVLWCLREPIPPVEAARAAVGTTVGSAPKRSEGAVASVPSTLTADLPQEATAGALSPTESAGRFRVGPGFVMEPLLAEPEIAQPVFLNFDERGRMWVVEYRQYPMPAGLTLVSHDSVWRNVYDKVPPPPPNHFRGADRISIHEDTDGDGRMDKHRIFVDGLNIATSVEHGRGGVWVLNPPYLLFYADENRDDMPDRAPEVRLSGFGIEDTHSVANSLRWGPDGWLYGAQGSTVTANITVMGGDGKPVNAKPIYSQGQNIWRYHPERRVYEVFSEGGGNAFGCEIDSKGRIFSGHNGGDTRGFHYVQGAYLQKGFEKHGPLSNPYAFGFFPAMGHHSAARFTHNFILYEGGGFPSGKQGRLFGVEPLQGRIVESELEPVGSTYRTRDVGFVVASEDRWFRPVDIKIGPDGALYICDWYDQQVNHYRNHEGKMDGKRGRIYRLRPADAKPARAEDLGRLSDNELIGRLSDSNRWRRQMIQRLLADRRARGVSDELKQRLRSGGGQLSLEALWGLNGVGAVDDAVLIEAMDHADPHVRAWAVRLACDLRAVSSAVAKKIAALGRTEPELEVRVQLAASAKRMTAGDGLAVLKGLVMHDEDAVDARMPLMIWWAMEAHCSTGQEEVLNWFRDSAVWGRPLVKGHLLERVMRRFAQTGLRRDLLACSRLFELAPNRESMGILSRGFELAYKGRPMVGLPEELVVAWGRHGAGSLAIRLRRGDREAMAKALQKVEDETEMRDLRLELMSILGEMREPSAMPVLVRVFRGAVGDDLIRRGAMLAMGGYDSPEVGEELVRLYPRLGLESRRTAQAMLASRVGWAKHWVGELAGRWSKDSAVGPGSTPLSIVRKLREFRDPEMRTMVNALWPLGGAASDEEREGLIARYARVVRGGGGDPYAGRAVYGQLCSPCHKLFGQGAEVGPDLTVYKRDDLEAILLSIVRPSAEIREGYESYSVETKDERSLTGFLVEQTSEIVVLRGLDGLNTTLNRGAIAEMKPSGASLMPEGLLEGMGDQSVRDLFAYLRSTQPLVGEAPRR